MISLSSLTKIKTGKTKKRIGRGYGSGKGGHTVGRGSKGQKARGKVGLAFSGAKSKKSWLKRLPLWRGKGRFKPRGKKLAINVGQLNESYRDGEKVSPESLAKKRLIKKKEMTLVKILGKGDLKKKLKVSVLCSGQAKEKIIAAGGQIIDKQIINK